MLIRTVVAPLLETNCVLVVDDAGRCIVVDPGAGVARAVLDVVDREGWDVVAMLATHGHVDHTWDAAELGDLWGVPLLLHEADAYRLDDPFGTLGPIGTQLAAAAQAGRGGVSAPPRPHRVEPFATEPGGTTELRLGPDGALVVTAVHAPGHTEGSTVFLVGAAGSRTALTGDVLFAGTIGRTDLPGGDQPTMERTLAGLARWDPAIAVLPGHGPATTIGAELAGNPYLRP